jgi:small subunit ribosomal protein S6
VTKYETVFILDPSYDENRVNEEVEKITGWLKDMGGEVVEVQRWGKKRLAYEINKKRDGVYTMLVWNGQGPSVKELERRMQLNENVMRVLTTLYVSPELSKGVPEGEAVPAGAVAEEGDE